MSFAVGSVVQERVTDPETGYVTVPSSGWMVAFPVVTLQMIGWGSLLALRMVGSGTVPVSAVAWVAEQCDCCPD